MNLPLSDLAEKFKIIGCFTKLFVVSKTQDKPK